MVVVVYVVDVSSSSSSSSRKQRREEIRIFLSFVLPFFFLSSLFFGGKI
jgi:hypothetical protein